MTLRLEVKVQNDADGSAQSEYPCPNQRVQSILSLLIEGLYGILALPFDLVREGDAAFAVALLYHFEDCRPVHWVVLNVRQKITTA